MTSSDQAVTTEPDTDHEPSDESIVSQSPMRRVGNLVFVQVPGPVPVVAFKRRRSRKK